MMELLAVPHPILTMWAANGVGDMDKDNSCSKFVYLVQKVCFYVFMFLICVCQHIIPGLYT